MNDFEYQNPTKILFGSTHYGKLKDLISNVATNEKILLTYGGGSIFKNGVHQKVKEQLSDFNVYEFGGIEPNPQFSTLMKAVEICRTENISFVLAVGGGSVIDGTKFICGAVNYNGDPWEVLERKPGKTFEEPLPFGTVLTLPATGSEANSGAVISRSEMKTKRTMGGPNLFPQFSICDPKVVASLPKRQIANGLVDAFVHTLEQYLTHPTGNLLQERQAEAILATLIEIGPGVMNNPSDYNLASNLMWCATHALNGNLRCGVPTDWATHMIGHELTALHNIDHARTLAIIGPRLFEALFDQKKEKLEQYGRRVWGLTGESEEVSREAIRKTEAFYHSLEISTKISEYVDSEKNEPALIREIFEKRGWHKLGEKLTVTPELVEKIVASAL